MLVEALDQWGDIMAKVDPRWELADDWQAFAGISSHKFVTYKCQLYHCRHLEVLRSQAFSGSTIRPFSKQYEPPSLGGTYQNWHLRAFIIYGPQLLVVSVGRMPWTLRFYDKLTQFFFFLFRLWKPLGVQHDCAAPNPRSKQLHLKLRAKCSSTPASVQQSYGPSRDIRSPRVFLAARIDKNAHETRTAGSLCFCAICSCQSG